jgi:hypothetical protein
MDFMTLFCSSSGAKGAVRGPGQAEEAKKPTPTARASDQESLRGPKWLPLALQTFLCRASRKGPRRDDRDGYQVPRGLRGNRDRAPKGGSVNWRRLAFSYSTTSLRLEL